MFCTPTRKIVARKQHSCTNCGQKILIGEVYCNWKSVDNTWFTSKMHPECFNSLAEENEYYGSFEYMPYSGERPEREHATL